MLDGTAVATPAERIAREARLVGFPLGGSTPLGALDRGPFLERWLAEGRAGEMGYLARRTAERMDPRMAFPWARSIVSLAYPYRPPPAPAGDWQAELRGRIAAYALGVDYHDRVGALLERLIARLQDVFPGARFRPYVDTGPVLEREWAARAGLGWIGKNTLILHRSHTPLRRKSYALPRKISHTNSRIGVTRKVSNIRACWVTGTMSP